MQRLQITLLGGIDVRGERGAVHLPTRKSKALLAYLALAPGSPHSRPKLAALLWDRSAEEQARASLRQTLFSLRQAFSQPEPLHATSDSVWLAADAIEVDVLVFEGLAAQQTPEALEQALALYRGDLLEGFDVAAEPFEEWLAARRARLRERALQAMSVLLAHRCDAHEWERAAGLAERILALDPLRESAHRALMRLHAAAGRRNAALQQYAACAQALARELSVEPEPATKALYGEILGARTVEAEARPASKPRERGLQQSIRFCTAPDGVRIAYATVGRGPPLVKAANWLNHLEYDWESPVWRHMLEALARDHFLVRYDERGNGLSDWDVADISFEAFVRDLETVVDALRLERFALLGISQGCAVSIAYAARHPERVTHLVLHGGYARGWNKQGSREQIDRHEALLTLTRSGWGQENPAFREVFTTLFIPDATPAQKQWFNDLERISTSPENAVRLQRAFGSIDVSALLPQVSAPTLVLHSRNESRVAFDSGRELASRIPAARFVPLESRNHVILEHEPAWGRWLAEIRGFLRDAASRSSIENPDRSADH